MRWLFPERYGWDVCAARGDGGIAGIGLDFLLCFS
jgi:hypothetical protein